jgi:hypothetical protein
MNKFCVYKHFTSDSNELFYIGEGTIKRAFSKFSRNKWWKHKVQKHNGFRVEIVANNLLKIEAEKIELELLNKHKSDNLVNLCNGTMFNSHWLVGKPKEMHPMFGKKSPESAKRIIEWNKLHSGVNSPTFGLKRPDLIERNKKGIFKRNFKKIICIDTGEIFNSVKDAMIKYPSKHYSRNIKNKWTICGLHFDYLTTFVEQEEQNKVVV